MVALSLCSSPPLASSYAESIGPNRPLWPGASLPLNSNSPSWRRAAVKHIAGPSDKSLHHRHQQNASARQVRIEVPLLLFTPLIFSLTPFFFFGITYDYKNIRRWDSYILPFYVSRPAYGFLCVHVHIYVVTWSSAWHGMMIWLLWLLVILSFRRWWWVTRKALYI